VKTSFRIRLAARFTLTMAVAMLALSVGSWIALRYLLDREVDSSILNVASIQAASLTDWPGGAMRFHEWELTPEEAVSIRELNRYAQVWDLSGRNLLRTRFITEDLPLDREALMLAAEGELVWREQTFDAIPIRSLYYPLERLGMAHQDHVLQVAAPLLARNRTLRTTALFLAGIFVVVVSGTWMGAWWLAGSAVRPMGAIIDQAEEIEAGTLTRRISAFADTREYQRLVQVLNTMLARLQGSFDTQRRFTADASHELRSPLTALRGELEVALRRPRGEEEYRQVLESALEEVDRLSRISEDLLTLARSDSGVMKPRFVDESLDRVLGSCVSRVSSLAERRRVSLEVDAEGDLRVPHDPDLMGRLVQNLLDNALEHVPEGGAIRISGKKAEGALVLEVHDSGPGFPPGLVDRVFERFLRADQARSSRPDGSQGTGLGLAIVDAITAAHGGSAHAGTSPMGGALIRVTIPTARPANSA
jgi:two-component system OmpR family sensor kinase